MRLFLVVIMALFSFILISCASSESGGSGEGGTQDNDTVSAPDNDPAQPDNPNIIPEDDPAPQPDAETAQPENEPVPDEEVVETEADAQPETDPVPDEEVITGELQITKRVLVETSMGNITLGLYGNEMPKTTANFMNYVGKSFYDGLIFHEVIKDDLIKGGGFDEVFKNKMPDAGIQLEANAKVKHLKYTVSMAIMMDKTVTSQFFIVLSDSPARDGQYPAFGTVLEGKDIVDAIGAVETSSQKNGIFKYAPTVPVKINKVSEIK